MTQTIKSGNRHITLDTENADLIGQHNIGSWGDPAGYSEKLYQSKTNHRYFIHGEGGPDSPYPTPQIKPVLKREALAF